jgi:putative ABC transport system permease protein
LGSQIMQLTLMALLATLVGLLGGYLLQFLLISALQDIINADLPPPSLKPVILGFVASFCVVFGVASPYLKILSESEPIRILRNDFSIGMARNWMIYLVASATMLIFLIILFKNIELILYIVGALIAVTILLFLIGKGMIYVLSFIKLSSGIGWKLGLKNIVQRGNESILQVIIFGLSLVFLLVLAETRTDLVDSWTDTLKEDTPNNFLFNIQEYDLKNISEYFADTADLSPVFTPLIRGRLLSVNRDNIELLDSDNVMEREANLTWQETLPESNTIVQGSWWQESSLMAEVSVDDSVAKSMDLKLGDELYFSAGGNNFYATVTSFREVSWESFSPNFFFLLSPSIGKTLPNSYITSIRIPEESNIMASFVERFPTITNVDIGAVIKQVQNTILSASLAVQYIFILALAAGILALIASIFSNTDQRKKEAAILHAIGAKRSLIFQAAALEFLVLGILSALTAVIAAIVLSGAIFTQVLELSYSPNPLILGTGFLAAIIFIFIAGILSIKKTIYASPMLTLKNG